jgi:uncharacterized membrane protein HdeD (DUF308 family)
MTNASATSPVGMLDGRGISWGWFLGLGVLMTALGVIGLGMTYALTIVAVFWFGVLAIVGGIAQILDAFHHKEWKGIVWHVIIGLVYIVAGVVMITMPVSSAFWLTIFLAAFLLIAGGARIVMAFQHRGEGSLWLLLLFSGIVSIVLGALIYGTITPPSAEALATAEGQLNWMRSWGWVIGLFVAIEFIMEGTTLIAMAFAVKSADPTIGAGGTPAAKPAP